MKIDPGKWKQIRASESAVTTCPDSNSKKKKKKKKKKTLSADTAYRLIVEFPWLILDRSLCRGHDEIF